MAKKLAAKGVKVQPADRTVSDEDCPATLDELLSLIRRDRLSWSRPTDGMGYLDVKSTIERRWGDMRTLGLAPPNEPSVESFRVFFLKEMPSDKRASLHRVFHDALNHAESVITEELSSMVSLNIATEPLLSSVTIASDTPPASTASPRDANVRLDDLALLLRMSKKTLERRYAKGKLCEPDVEGGGGKPHLWLYQRIRPHLGREFGHCLVPEQWPGVEVAFRR